MMNELRYKIWSHFWRDQIFKKYIFEPPQTKNGEIDHTFTKSDDHLRENTKKR